jgi:hypothetical protein
MLTALSKELASIFDVRFVIRSDNFDPISTAMYQSIFEYYGTFC